MRMSLFGKSYRCLQREVAAEKWKVDGASAQAMVRKLRAYLLGLKRLEGRFLAAKMDYDIAADPRRSNAVRHGALDRARNFEVGVECEGPTVTAYFDPDRVGDLGVSSSRAEGLAEDRGMEITRVEGWMKEVSRYAEVLKVASGSSSLSNSTLSRSLF